jgi:hypothetical protein
MAAPIAMTTPSGLAWTTEKSNNARDIGMFLFVNDVPGSRLTKRSITGAEAKWKSQNPQEYSIVFIPEFSIAGTPSSIRAALLSASYSPAQVEAAIASGINRSNFQSGQAAAYQAAIARYDSLKPKKAKAAPAPFSTAQLVALADPRNPYEVVKLVTIRRDAAGNVIAAGATPSRKAPAQRKTLQQRVDALPAGKYLNVSEIKVDEKGNVTGTRTIDIPKGTGARAGGKVGVKELPVVSNNLESYILALELLYGSGARQQYAAWIASVQAQLAGLSKPSAPRAASPRARAASPKKSPPRTVIANQASPSRAQAGPATIGGAAYPGMPPRPSGAPALPSARR